MIRGARVNGATSSPAYPSSATRPQTRAWSQPSNVSLQMAYFIGGPVTGGG